MYMHNSAQAKPNETFQKRTDIDKDKEIKIEIELDIKGDGDIYTIQHCQKPM